MVVITKEQKLVANLKAAKAAWEAYINGDESLINDDRTDELTDVQMDAESAIIEFLITKHNVDGENAANMRFAAEELAARFCEMIAA
jgi:hypothetical protein